LASNKDFKKLGISLLRRDGPGHSNLEIQVAANDSQECADSTHSGSVECNVQCAIRHNFLCSHPYRVRTLCNDGRCLSVLRLNLGWVWKGAASWKLSGRKPMTRVNH